MVNSPEYNSVYSRHYCQVINKNKTAYLYVWREVREEKQIIKAKSLLSNIDFQPNVPSTTTSF